MVTTENQQTARQTKLGGIGNLVAHEIEKRLGRETRTMVLGHLQRGGPPSTVDRLLATQFGAHAVRLVIEGRCGEMGCSHPPASNSVRIADAVHRLKRVHPTCSAVQAARALGISFGDQVEAGPFSPVRADSDAMLGLSPALLPPLPLTSLASASLPLTPA